MLGLPARSPSSLLRRLIFASAVVILGVLVMSTPMAGADEVNEAMAPDQADSSAELPGVQPAAEVDAVAGSLTVAEGRLPARLRLPSIGVEMEVEAVGDTPDGNMGAPTDPDRAGWYQFGPRPGERGNAAIGGHVDWDGRARPFWYLRRLQEGDPVEVVSADGQLFEFQVQWMRMYDVSDAPLEEIFGSSGIPEVTLITCGGTFDHYNHAYLSRLVVRAAMRVP